MTKTANRTAIKLLYVPGCEADVPKIMMPPISFIGSAHVRIIYKLHCTNTCEVLFATLIERDLLIYLFIK